MLFIPLLLCTDGVHLHVNYLTHSFLNALRKSNYKASKGKTVHMRRPGNNILDSEAPIIRPSKSLYTFIDSAFQGIYSRTNVI